MCVNHYGYALFSGFRVLLLIAYFIPIMQSALSQSSVLIEPIKKNGPFPYRAFFNSTLGYENYLRFFNVNENEIPNYLCTVGKRRNKKCCSCYPNCVGNCCIDAFWESARETTIQDYLNMFVERHKSRKCLPVIPLNTTDHVVEHLYVVHSYYDGSKVVACSGKEFPKFVLSGRGIVYISDFCAAMNRDMFIDLEILVRCKKAANIYEGQIFSLRHLRSAQECIVSVAKVFGRRDFPFCYNQLDDCSKSDLTHDLCKAYSLNLKVHKNPHCLLCDGKNLSSYVKVENCSRYRNTNSPSLNNAAFQVSFKLIVNRHKQYIIKDLIASFPVEEFLGLSEVSDNFYEVLTTFLCHHKKSDSSRCCSCDRWCFKFQSCCMDILWNESHPIEINEYKHLLVDHSKQYKKHTCERINGRSTFVVSSCLPNTSKEELKNCLNQNESYNESSTSTAVLGIDNYLYKNKFCARCNSIFRFQESQSDRGGLFNIFNTKNDKNRPCDARRGTCQPGNPYFDLCHSYIANINPTIANLHCYLCTSTKKFDLYIDNSCIATHTLSKLVSFNFLKESKPLVCSKGQIYNPSENKCESIRCLRGFELRGSKCEPKVKVELFIDINNSTFDRCLTNSEPKLYLEFRNISFFENLCWYLKVTNCSTSNHSFIDKKNRTTYIQKLELESNIEFIKNLSFYYNELEETMKQGKAKIRITSSHSVILNKFYRLDYLSNFPNYKICQKIRVLDIGQVNFTSNCGIIYNNSLYSWTNVSSWIILDESNITKTIAICDEFYMISNCSLTFLPNSEIMLNEGGSITYLKGTSKEKAYQVEEYVPTEKGVLTCIHATDSFTDTWSSLLQKVEIYISLICFSISIPSYILVFSTFCLFDQLRTIPGKCTLMLTCSLLIGDTLLLSSTIFQAKDVTIDVSFCKAISILIHCALILAQTWCFVIALDLTLTFNSTASLIIQRGSSRFRIYFATTVVFSLCFVTLSVLFDYFKVVYYDYAKDDICMPHGSYGHLYFYLIPTLVGFLSSLILLIKIMLKISYDNRRNQNILGSDRTMNVASMALKLALVLGFSEGIGFIQNPGSKGVEKIFFQIVSILYSLIRSLRGLLIALVYLCRKEVLESWKERIKPEATIRSDDTATSRM